MIVPEEAKQTALIRVQDWTWVNHTIWMDRMLEALGNGVKGGKWSQMLAKCFLRQCRALHIIRSLELSDPVPMRKRPTGEPCAGEPHARFGGRGGLGLPDPYPGSVRPIAAG